jgi:hypothetical protein
MSKDTNSNFSEAKMKKFIISTLCVAIFFIGLGGLIQETGARFKSDDRALELIKQARQAIGGEEAIKSVRGLTIIGKATQISNINGAEQTKQGDLELNLQLPNKFSKMTRYNVQNGEVRDEKVLTKEIREVILNKSDDNVTLNRIESGSPDKKVIRLKRVDESGSGERIENLDGAKLKVFTDVNTRVGTADKFRQNELFRTTFALLLSAPEGQDVSYSYVGEDSVDGNSCDMVQAQTGESSFKLCLSKTSHLPLMISYRDAGTLTIRTNVRTNNDDANKTTVIDGKAANVEMPEIQIKFSDFRTVGSVQLPFTWTQTIGGKASQTVAITNYELNPANIAEKFKNRRVMIKADQSQ